MSVLLYCWQRIKFLVQPAADWNKYAVIASQEKRLAQILLQEDKAALSSVL